MENKGKMPWLRILLWGGIGIHFMLISLSFIEVAIYSLLINPGQCEPFYTEHAQKTAPIISIVFGIILFYVLSKRLSRNKAEIARRIAFALVSIYIFTDIAILILSQANWQEMKFVFLISCITKSISAYAGAVSNKD